MTRARLVASDTFRSLNTRNFRLFFIGQATSQTGTWMEMVAMTWLVLQLTGSGVALGLVTAAKFLPLLVLGAWAGLLADRLDRHHFMLAAQVAFAVVAGVLAILVLLDAYSVGVLYGFALVFGLITALDNPTRRALVNDLVDRDDLANAVGLNSTLMTGSRVVGPAVAGALIAGPGVAWCFVLNAASYLAVIVALLRMDRSAIQPAPRVEKAKGQLREGLAYVRRTPELLLPLLLVTVIGTLAFNYQVTLPLLADRTLNGDATTFTLLFSTLSLGSVAGALTLARRQDLTVTAILKAASGLAVTLAALALAPNATLAMVAAVGVGFTGMFVISGSNALVQLRADTAMRGRVLALFGIVFLGSTPIGGPIVGTVAEVFNPRVSILVGAVAAAGAALWMARRIRNMAPTVRALTAEPEPAPSPVKL
jgi:MFS family permease